MDMSGVDVNRLTDDDRERMSAAVVATMRRWDEGAVAHSGRGAWYLVRPVDLDTLERLACHAIGCDTRDMRESEIAETVRLVGELAVAHNDRHISTGGRG